MVKSSIQWVIELWSPGMWEGWEPDLLHKGARVQRVLVCVCVCDVHMIFEWDHLSATKPFRERTTGHDDMCRVCDVRMYAVCIRTLYSWNHMLHNSSFSVNVCMHVCTSVCMLINLSYYNNYSYATCFQFSYFTPTPSSLPSSLPFRSM